jgi:nucleoside 2-deoxyribosyltransferase
MSGENFSQTDCNRLSGALQRLCSVREAESIRQVVREVVRDLVGSDGVTCVVRETDGQEKDRQRSAEAGFVLHLVKPVQLPTVLDALAMATTTLSARGDALEGLAE